MAAGRRAGYRTGQLPVTGFYGVIWRRGGVLWECEHVHAAKAEAMDCARTELAARLQAETVLRSEVGSGVKER